MKTALLTAERVRDVLDYDPDTGVFTWRQKLNRRMVVGAVAGTALKSGRSAGRRTIHIDQIGEAASRIAWLHFYGEHPKHCIDHINGNPGDDRIANLRDVPPVGNSQNLRRQHAEIAELKAELERIRLALQNYVTAIATAGGGDKALFMAAIREADDTARAALTPKD